MHRRVEGVLRGELVDQYAGGVAGRATEIGNGAARQVHEIVEDVCDWSSRLDELFATLPAATWPQPVRTVLGGQHPVALLPFRRWREVEVHLVDLDLGFSCADWSQDLVERALPRLISGLPDRADHRDLMAWILGRASPPELERWG